MRMKRIIAMLISVVLLCFTLVGCNEFDADYWRDRYNVQETVVYNVYYDFYVICEDGTEQTATRTVNDSINQIIKKYNTQLQIHYLSASEYETKLQEDIAAGAPDLTGTEFAGYNYGGRIVLINNKDMLDNSAYNFANLASYLETTKFGTLKPQYTSPLLTAAYIDGNLYGIPNNRVFGGYDYIKIDREFAERTLGFSALTTLSEITSLDDEDALELKAAIAAYNTQNGTSINEDDIISKVENESYEYKQITESIKVESTERQKWIVNVAKYPEANAYEAYASAYGIIPSANLTTEVDDPNNAGQKITVTAVDYVDRAMEIIFALNTDESFRNTLQYGVQGANYLVNNGVVTRIEEQDRNYKMNIEYTGDVFKAYFNAEWTSESAAFGLQQNKESVLPEN